ncbi:MAG: MFS transporter, partial [Bifidobacteriaceae bacterium]|nr:MFS transporter [Bifidobacteriaceae bacterium]
MMVDIDDSVLEVHGYKKQGAGRGYTGKKGLNMFLATVSGKGFRPVVVASRLRKGSAASARGAARLVQDSLKTVSRTHLAGRPVVFRADSAFFGHPTISAALGAGAAVVVVTAALNADVKRAIAGIPQDAWVKINYTDAIWDEDQQRWISDAEVAAVPFTAFAAQRKANHVKGRLVVRRVKELNPKAKEGQDELFASWRHHPVFTTLDAADYSAVKVDEICRDHAIIEQVNSDLKASAMAHCPSGMFNANAAWLVLAAIAHNLLRAAATLTGDTVGGRMIWLGLGHRVWGCGVWLVVDAGGGGSGMSVSDPLARRCCEVKSWRGRAKVGVWDVGFRPFGSALGAGGYAGVALSASMRASRRAMVRSRVTMGRVMKAVDLRIMILASGAFVAAFQLAIALSDSITVVYAIAPLHGFGSTWGGVAMAQTVITRWFDKGRGTMMSLCMVIMGLALVVAIPVVGGLIEANGYRPVIMMVGVIAGLVVSLSAFLVSAEPAKYGLRPLGAGAADDHDAGAPGVPSLAWRSIVRTPVFWAIWVIVVLATLACQGFNSQAAVVFGSLGLDATNSAFAFSLFTLMSIPMQFAFGIMCDKFGAKISMYLFGGVSAAVLLLAVAWAGWIGAVALGFGMSVGGV